jgi:hypothetical protein
MTPMPPIPVSRYLVPAAAPPPPDTFTTTSLPIAGGLPFTHAVDARWSVTLRYPTGVARRWLDADPHEVVSSDIPERTAVAADPSDPGRDPVRLTVALDRSTRATIPLTAGLRTFVVGGGTPPAALELIVVSWTITAGTVKGPGDFGSSLQLAWRDGAEAVEVFATPPVSPPVLERLPRLVQPPFEILVLESRPAILLERKLVAVERAPIRRVVDATLRRAVEER